jgi:hypothetical protein
MTQIIFLSVFFIVLMVGMLWDLGVFSKSTHDEVTAKQALLHTLGWFSVGLLMTAFVYLFHGDLQSIAQMSDLMKYQVCSQRAEHLIKDQKFDFQKYINYLN